MKKIIFMCLCVLALTACGTRTETGKSNIETELKENVEVETDYASMNFSNQLDNIDTIKEQTITEARIYHGDGTVYRTTDKEILSNIIDKIATLELTEINPETLRPVEGSSKLYLLNGNDVVYYFHYSAALYIGGKYYGPEKNAYEFEEKVMNYCRETFYIVPED